MITCQVLCKNASVLLVVSLVLSAPVLSQTPSSETGDAPFGTIDGTNLNPTKLSYAGAAPANKTLTATTTDGRDTWTIVQNVDANQSTLYDSLVVDRKTLRPLFRYRHEQDQALRLTFNNRSVTGAMNTGSDSTPIEKKTEDPILASRMHALLALGTMPLESGFSTTVQILLPSVEVASATYEVVGTQTVGQYSTYVVNSTVSHSGSTFKRTAYLRQKAPHHLVKLEADKVDETLQMLVAEEE